MVQSFRLSPSVLSADESCCAWLCASTSSAHALLTALAACASRAPLAVRLAYALGNMAAADEHARINVSPLARNLLKFNIQTL